MHDEQEILERFKELLLARENLKKAVRNAYPNLSNYKKKQIQENVYQIVEGLLEFDSISGYNERPTHMDASNALVCQCFRNTYLEELHAGKEHPDLKDPKWSRITDEEMEKLMKECAARAADWLLMVETLKGYPSLYDSFVRGGVIFGAMKWEKDRGKLGYK